MGSIRTGKGCKFCKIKQNLEFFGKRLERLSFHLKHSCSDSEAYRINRNIFLWKLLYSFVAWEFCWYNSRALCSANTTLGQFTAEEILRESSLSRNWVIPADDKSIIVYVKKTPKSNENKTFTVYKKTFELDKNLIYMYSTWLWVCIDNSVEFLRPREKSNLLE